MYEDKDRVEDENRNEDRKGDAAEAGQKRG